MTPETAVEWRSRHDALTDEEIARRVREGERELFELLMRRHNQQVYRAVRGVLKDAAEIEDVMQQAYVLAFTHLDQFAGAARLSTWLVRIALNEAFARLRRAKKLVALLPDDDFRQEETMAANGTQPPNPEQQAAAREITTVVERAVDELPEIYRTAFVLREIEGMTTAEASEALGTSEEVVKTRLHRAKAMVQQKLATLTGQHLGDSFPFHATRCDRVVHAVMARIAALRPEAR